MRGARSLRTGNQRPNTPSHINMYEEIRRGVVKLGKLLVENVRCLACGWDLSHGQVYGYPHAEGYEVEGIKLWLYVECPRCRRQNSFRTLRIRIVREAEASGTYASDLLPTGD